VGDFKGPLTKRATGQIWADSPVAYVGVNLRTGGIGVDEKFASTLSVAMACLRHVAVRVRAMTAGTLAGRGIRGEAH